MESSVRDAIASIEVKRGTEVITRGTACLVGTNVVLTALHVVADRTTEPPQFYPGEITLRFPDHAPITATVLEGRWDPLEDWVLLTCAPPETIRPLSLATIERDGEEWSAHGFPDAEPAGLTIHGTVSNSQGDLSGGRIPVYQLYCREAAAGRGLRVKGLSGAPVIVDRAVIGVIRRSPLEDDRNEGGTLFACPASLIAVRCPKYFPEPLRSVSSVPPAAALSPAAARGWKRWAIAAATLAVALVTGVLIVQLKSPAGSFSDMNQEIVVDSSSAMSAIFGNEKMTKLEAAVEALKTIPLLKRDNLALRAVGGDCHQDNGSRMVVDFGTNRQNEIKTAAQEHLSPRGQPALVFGIVSAIADVASLRNARRVIVLTGGDICPKEDLQEIKVRLDAAKLDSKDLDIRLIGLGVSAADKAKLRAIAKTVGGGAHFVDTTARLNEVLAWALSFDPAMKDALKHVDDVVEVVLGPTVPLNDFGDRLNERNFEEARKLLAAAQASVKNGKERFDALAKTRPSANFQRLYELAAEARSLHQADLQIGQELLQYGEDSGGRPERPATVDKWNAAIGTWLENTRKFNVTLREIEQQVDAIRQETKRRL